MDMVLVLCGDYPLITISSDGHLSPVDDIRSTNPEMMVTNHTVKNSTLSEFFNLKIFQKIKSSAVDIPEKCSNCYWLNACGGGALINRYSSTTDDFNHPSVFCDGLKKFYTTLSSYLLKNGYPFAKLASNLGLEEAIG